MAKHQCPPSVSREIVDALDDLIIARSKLALVDDWLTWLDAGRTSNVDASGGASVITGECLKNINAAIELLEAASRKIRGLP